MPRVIAVLGMLACHVLAGASFATQTDDNCPTQFDPTVAVSLDAPTGRQSDHADTLNHIPTSPLNLQLVLDNIDQLAKVLRAEGLLTSPRAWRERSAAFNLPALDLPRRYGGARWSATAMVKVFEHAGRLALDLRDIVGAGHARLLTYGSSVRSKHQEIVEQVALGRGYMAVAITEERAGSDLHNMTTTSIPTKGGYVINGSKMYNARLKEATHVVVLTTSADPHSRGSLNAFVLPIDHPGIEITDFGAHGLHGNSFGGIKFDNVIVPSSALIGQAGKGGDLFRTHFLYWRLMMTAAALGTAKEALNQASLRLRERSAFGGAIARFTHLQQDLAQHTAKLHMVTLLVADAAKLLDTKNSQAQALVAMAKAEGVEYALAAADFAMELFAAEGYSDRTDLAQRVADLQGLRIADGTTAVLRQDAVRRTYGSAFWDAYLNHDTSVIESQSPAALFQQLRAANVANYGNVLPDQDPFLPFIDESGGGACATVCGGFLLQAMRLLSGYQSPLNLIEVLISALQEFPALRGGRVTNDELVAFIAYLQKYTPQSAWQLEHHHATNSSHALATFGTRVWPEFPDALLETKPRELSLIIFTMKRKDGSPIGRHFVLLEQHLNEDNIAVLDPNYPMTTHKYFVRKTMAPEGTIVALQRTDKLDQMQREVDSVIKVRLP